MTRPLPLSAHIGTIGKLFASASLVPAAVKRDFKWEEADCQFLLDDIDRVFMAASDEERIMTQCCWRCRCEVCSAVLSQT